MDNPFINLKNLERFLENLRRNNTDSLEVHTSNFNNPHNVNKSQIGLGNVDNTSDIDKPVSSAQDTFIKAQDNIIISNSKSYTDAAKSSAISIAAADATSKTNVVQNNLNNHTGNIIDAHDIANRLQALKITMNDYVDQSISDIIGGAPEILDTLRELSNALGNDPNFSVSITNLIGQKLNSSEVVTVPTANKILRLDANAKYPASVIAQNANNRFFTDAERTKLANISDGATNFTHPLNHPPSIITQDSNNRFVTDSEKSVWNGKQNKLSNATPTVGGIMSGPDKNKLDGIESGANKTIIIDNLVTSNKGTALDASQGKILNDTKAPLSHTHTKDQVGLGNVDNTADSIKDVDSATRITTLGVKNAVDLPSTYPVGMSTHQVYNNGYPCAYGNTLTIKGAGSGTTQIVMEWSGYNPPGVGQTWYRNGRDVVDTWSPFKKIGITSASELTEGVLAIACGGTGTTSKTGIVNLLYSAGDRSGIDTNKLHTFIFEPGGENSGYLTLLSLKNKIQWTTPELQAALNRLPNI